MTQEPNTKLDEEVKPEEISSSASNWHDSSLIKLLVTSIVAGLVIVVYVLIIVKIEKNQVKIDPFENATTFAASELTKITVSHPRFGIIGLTDTRLNSDVSYSMEPPLVRSFNSVNLSMKVASTLATNLDSKIVFDLLEEDLSLLSVLEHKLWTKLNNTVSQKGIQDEHSIYNKTFSLLEKSLPNDTTLIKLKLTIGGYGKSSGRATFVNCQKAEYDQPYVEHGFYKENFSIPVTKEHYIRFYKIYSESKIAPSKNFILKSEDMLPSAILLEATVKKIVNNNETKFLKKSICSLIGTEQTPNNPTCLVLRFPQGSIKNHDSLAKFLNPDTWQGQGSWGQATGADVPGQGTLNPTIDPVLKKMSPDTAISVSIYNWIKSISPAPDAERFIEMLSAKFLKESISKTSSKEINSCLTFDTGARQRAFLRGSYPGGVGQRGLSQCFEYPHRETTFPSSSIPLIVDKNGQANICGRSKFDSQLIQNYLDSIYTTNLCAIETMNQAKQIAKTYQSKLKNASSKEKEYYKRIVELSRAAGKNGLDIASKSFEIAQRNFTLCNNGLHYIAKPTPVYLLSRSQVFIPINTPLSEEEVLRVAKSASNKSQSKARSQWLQSNYKILLPWEKHFKSNAGILVEGEPLDLILAEKVHPIRYRPLTVIFDSRDLKSQGQIIPHTGMTYPFKAEPLKLSQALFYCPNALHTGQNPAVSWSLLVKDNSFHKGTDLSGNKFGRRKRIWCDQFKPPFSTFPTLSTEIQLRRPLPIVKNVPVSTFVEDPRFDRKVPLVPPVPATLM